MDGVLARAMLRWISPRLALERGDMESLRLIKGSVRFGKTKKMVFGRRFLVI